MTKAPFLIAKDVEYTTSGGDLLLQKSSFELEEGAILAIAGPNGAGKTTLLNTLCGVTEPSFGEVYVKGQNLHKMSALERARMIAVVGQQEQPDARLSLRDYVSLGQIPIKADHSAKENSAALEETLALTGLTHFASKKMGVLSGGERQRAHIARALAQNPSLLFLDEPTNHLDPDAKGRMLSLVCDLRITAVMIVHDLVLIPEFATHLALMNNAELVSFGRVSEVLTADHVRDVFGVDFRSFEHEGRLIPTLDIRKSPTSYQQRSL